MDDLKIADDVDLVTREEWGAAAPRKARHMKMPIHNIIFTYCTDIRGHKWPPCKNHEECSRTLQDMQKYYMEEEEMRDIPYNFVVGGDGRVYEGRGYYARPAKIKEWSVVYGYSYEIAYMGDHHERRPHKKMWRAAWDFVVLAIEKRIIHEDYEIVENYDLKRLDEIQAKKPWYKQWYHYAY